MTCTSCRCGSSRHRPGRPYLDVNRGFLDGLGYTRQEVIGRSVLALGIWVDPAARQSVVEALCANRPVQNYETRFRKRNGEEIWCLMSASPVEWDGTPCILSVTRDITERKRYEDTLRLARDTAEDANRALQEANAELQRLATTDPLTSVWNRRRFDADAAALRDGGGRDSFDDWIKRADDALYDAKAGGRNRAPSA